MFRNDSGRKFALLTGFVLCFALLCQGAFAAAPLATIDNYLVTPRMVGDSGSDDLDLVSPGLDNVGVGKVVYFKPILSSDASSTGTFVWSTDGTTATVETLSSATLTADGIFKIKVLAEGALSVQLTPLDADSNPTTTTELSLWVSTFAGTSTCVGCHQGINPDITTNFPNTNHATAMTRFLDTDKTGHFASYCLPCHNVGSYQPSLGDGNFIDLVAQEPVTSPTLTENIVAWANDPTAVKDNFSKLPANIQNLANIGCEACHGAGATHMGDVSKITKPDFSSDVCASCHDAPTHHLKPYQLSLSGHASEPYRATGSCAPCHTGEGFVAITVEGGLEEDMTVPGSERHGQTCITCHDPHDPTNEHQLRKIDAVTLPNGAIYDSSLGNLCVNCHNSRREGADEMVAVATGSYRGAHHGPQADVFLGTMAYDFGTSYPAATKTPVHLTVVTEGCVTCHMASQPSGGRTPPAVGDHTFRINTVLGDGSTTSSVAAACNAVGCHTGLDTTDRSVVYFKDWDGNGTQEGVQTEVRGILANLQAAILAADPRLSMDDHNTIGSSSSIFKTQSVNLHGAILNYNLAVNDGSYGVHNRLYTIASLQRAYHYLTGTPYDTAFPDAYSEDLSAGPTDGAPVISEVAGGGAGAVDVLWDSPNAPELQVLGFAYDLYTGDFVDNGSGDIWHNLSSATSSGQMDLGFSGAYFVWVGNQYADGGWFPSDASTILLNTDDAPPHTPLGVTATDGGSQVVTLTWTPEAYGTWLYWVIAYDGTNGEWATVNGPLGDSIWQYVVYGDADYDAGSVDLTVPAAGDYWFFIQGMAWDATTFGEFATPAGLTTVQ